MSQSVLFTLADATGPVPRIVLRETEQAGLPPLANRIAHDMLTQEAPGQRYQLLGEIARGGMGAILKGRDTDLGRDLAVKVLLEKHRGKTELAHRFIEEAQIAGQLQHPGI